MDTGDNDLGSSGRRPRKSGVHAARNVSSAQVSAADLAAAAAKRQQVSRACKRCATSKRKCSGTFPCERCVRMGAADSCEEVEPKRALPGSEGKGRHEHDNMSERSSDPQKRKRANFDDDRSESGLSTAMSRARLAEMPPQQQHGPAYQGDGMQEQEQHVSESQLASNLELLLRASDEKDGTNSSALEAARAQVRAALCSGRLLPRQVEIAPTVVVDLVPPPGVLVEAGHDPVGLSPYPAVRLTFPRYSGDGQPVAVAFNQEALALFGASSEALPRALVPGPARAPGACAPNPLWLHPDEVVPRAQLAAYVRSRGGHYYEWPGRYICTVWRAVDPASPEASHPEAVHCPAASYGSVQASAPGSTVARVGKEPGPHVLVPRHMLFCAWERVFISYHPRQLSARGTGKLARRQVAHTLSVYTCIEPLGQELYLTSGVATVRNRASLDAGSGVSPIERFRHSFGAGYLPAPVVAAASVGESPPAQAVGSIQRSLSVSSGADTSRKASVTLDSSIAALSGVGLSSLVDHGMRRASSVASITHATGTKGVTDASRSLNMHWSFASLGGGNGNGNVGSRPGSFAAQAQAADESPPAEQQPAYTFRTGLSMSSMSSQPPAPGTPPAGSDGMIELADGTHVPAARPSALFHSDGPREQIKFRKVDGTASPPGPSGSGGLLRPVQVTTGHGSRAHTAMVVVPPAVPREHLDEGGEWDDDALMETDMALGAAGYAGSFSSLGNGDGGVGNGAASLQAPYGSYAHVQMGMQPYSEYAAGKPVMLRPSLGSSGMLQTIPEASAQRSNAGMGGSTETDGSGSTARRADPVSAGTSAGRQGGQSGMYGSAGGLVGGSAMQGSMTLGAPFIGSLAGQPMVAGFAPAAVGGYPGGRPSFGMYEASPHPGAQAEFFTAQAMYQGNGRDGYVAQPAGWHAGAVHVMPSFSDSSMGLPPTVPSAYLTGAAPQLAGHAGLHSNLRMTSRGSSGDMLGSF